jgi:hypothetical protein
MCETPVNVTAKALIAGSMALFLAACGDGAKLPEEAAFGPSPTLPAQLKDIPTEDEDGEPIRAKAEAVLPLDSTSDKLMALVLFGGAAEYQMPLAKN